MIEDISHSQSIKLENQYYNKFQILGRFGMSIEIDTRRHLYPGICLWVASGSIPYVESLQYYV